MFENIINQVAVDSIVNDVLNKKLPRSILFTGPENSAKLTTALELARVLACQKNAEWTCACSSCQEMRAMKSLDLLIIGTRDLSIEIKVAANTFLNAKTKGSQFLFFRAVKKLLLRFDPRIWDSDESRFVKASPLIAETQQLLNDVSVFVENEDEVKLKKSLEKIIELVEKIQSTCMYETIPVNQVRKSLSWMRLTPTGKFKFLIIENAERMQEAARTAFLKILEEPPKHAFFILTSSRQAAIMPTILSRVRPYKFLKRDTQTEIEIIERVFQDKNLDTKNEENILNNYFKKFLPVDFHKIKNAALDFWNCIFVNYADNNSGLNNVKSFIAKQNIQEHKTISQILDTIDKGKNTSVFQNFLEQLVEVLQVVLNSQNNCTALEIENFNKASKIILKWKNANAIYNLSEQAILESIAMEISKL
ncbi:MAG: hypothetical protein P1P64_07925 [Treponemataceae bacterium]